jgi:mRNA interferase RelE/StbE
VSAWRIDLPPHVAEVVRHLPPEIKQAVKAALRSIAIEPATGEPLRGELEGLWKFRVRRYRLVYAVDRRQRVIRIFAVGHRRGIYEEISRSLRRPPA